MEAEKEKLKNENMHLEAALAYRELEMRATQLERQLKKTVNKARFVVYVNIHFVYFNIHGFIL